MAFADKTLGLNPQGFGIHQQPIAVENHCPGLPVAKSPWKI